MIFLQTFGCPECRQHYPIGATDQIVHEAYRAMQAGVNNYLSMAKLQSDTADLRSTVDKVSNYPQSADQLVEHTDPAFRCRSCAQGQPRGLGSPCPTSPLLRPGAWYLYGTPPIYYCTGSTSQCPETVWVSTTVVGRCHLGRNQEFTPGTATFQPQNGFLLNLWWLTMTSSTRLA